MQNIVSTDQAIRSELVWMMRLQIHSRGVWARCGTAVGRSSFIWALLVLSASANQPSAPGRPSPTELQTACLRYREASTRQGHVIFQRTREERGDQKKGEYRIWCSDERLRFDVRGPTTSGEWGEWEYYVADTRNYIWVPAGEPEGLIAPVSDYGREKGGVIGHFGLCHPRWLGMDPNSEAILQIEPNARFVDGNITKAEYEVVREQILGFETWRVTRKTSFPGAKAGAPRIRGEFVMWFAPTAGGSLVRAELREFGDKGTFARSVESRLEQFPEGGVWFPRRVTRETSFNGKITRREVIDVKDAYFGRKIDDRIFSVEGMEDLRKGKRIADRTQGSRETTMIW